MGSNRIIHPSELKSLRTSADMTQEELAKAADLTQAYIAKIESGNADPKISTLEKISESLLSADIDRGITAREIMTKPIIFVKPNDELRKAIRLMESNDISQIPVISDQRQVGSLAEDMIIHRISSEEKIFELAKEKVEEIMGDPFPTVGTETDIETLFHLLEYNPAVLVLSRDKAEGIITKADVLQLSATQKE